MLFDLRGRGRRRTVRVLYIGLALLIGVGLVGFGVGGGFGGGGLLSAATNSEGSNSASYQKQIAKYRKLVQTNPRDVKAWENLTRNLVHEAGGEGFLTSTGLTSQGHKVFEETGKAWNSYLALEPNKPNLELTKDMLRIYGEEGLNQPSQQVTLLQVIVAAEPSNVSYYADLAELAYKAHDTSIADLASQKAVSLAPPNERERLKRQLSEFKKNLEKESSSSPLPSVSGSKTISTPQGVITSTGAPTTSTTKVKTKK